MSTKTKNIIMVLAIVVVFAIGSVCAYFTDAEQVVNTFTVGSVDITLDEPSYDPDNALDMYAGKVIAKDPTITNVGINDAYVYIQLYMPKAELETAQEDGTKNPIQLMEIFSYDIDSNWELLNKDTTDEVFNVYLYAYKNILAKNEKTTPLFDKVTLANITHSSLPIAYSTYLKNVHANVGVLAYAIQSDGTGTSAEAWEKYCVQNPDM